MNEVTKPSLPKHVEDAVKQITEMHREHRSEAKPTEWLTDRAVAVIGTPTFFGLVFLIAILWMFLNTTAKTQAFDPPPFPILDTIISLVAILIAILILAAQRRDNRLATRREQMDLQVSLATEQKVSKLIELVEELRRDMPEVANRVDLDAIEMTSTTGHKEALATVEADARHADKALSPGESTDGRGTRPYE